MSTTTEHKLVELTRKVAAGNPDFVYEPERGEYGSSKCVYVRDGKPSCIIGHSALEAGFIDLNIEINPNNDLGIEEVLRRVKKFDEFSHADLAWLEAVQEAQDSGQTWREAVESADEARAEYIEGAGEHDDN